MGTSSGDWICNHRRVYHVKPDKITISRNTLITNMRNIYREIILYGPQPYSCQFIGGQERMKMVAIVIVAMDSSFIRLQKEMITP